ncbi:thiol peroxidase [Acidobacteriota bacterium]
MERTGKVTFNGNPLTLIGPDLKAGSKAPEFTAINKDLQKIRLSDSEDTVRLFNVVPSLDTPICSLQTKRFNEELKKLGDGVTAYTISCDLPFAQKRFCEAESIGALTFLSDHRETSFGQAYGVLIKELRLLARALFVVDKTGSITYVQLVPEVAQEPDYDDALQALKSTLAG